MLVTKCGKNIVSNKSCLLTRLFNIRKFMKHSFVLVPLFSFFFGAVNVINLTFPNLCRPWTVRGLSVGYARANP